MQSKSSNNIAWADHPAQKILVADLEAGILPPSSATMPPKEVWDTVYAMLPKFSGMEYTKFCNRLCALWNAYSASHRLAARDAAALQHDCKLHPRKLVNARGEPVFDLSPAKLLLQQDVKNKKHVSMTLAALCQSRNEYLVFDCCIFSGRVWQEIRRQKFVHYLELKCGGVNSPKELAATEAAQEKRWDKMKDASKKKKKDAKKRKKEAKRTAKAPAKKPRSKK